MHYFNKLSILYLLLVILLSFGCNQQKKKGLEKAWEYFPEQSSINAVKGFPVGPSERALILGVDKFNFLYAEDVLIDSVIFLGTITDTKAVAAAMMQTIAIPSQENDTSKLWIATRKDIEGKVDQQKLVQLRKNIELNVQEGHFLILVKMHEVESGKKIETLNSMSADATAFSGSFFLNAVVSGSERETLNLPNTNCTERTLCNYIFTSTPKIILKVCVRALCEGDQIFDCIITEAGPSKIGPFAEVEVAPKPKSGVPPKGKITRNCCDGTVSYAWTTGFKSIKAKLDVDGVVIDFEIEGIIGRSGEGFLTVTECCDSVINNVFTPSGTGPESSVPYKLEINHRGRLQVQGKDLRKELSYPWAQDKPFKASIAKRELSKMRNQLSKKEFKLRTEAFPKCENYIDKGPYDAPASRTFQNRNLPENRKDARVDSEIRKGKAYIK